MTMATAEPTAEPAPQDGRAFRDCVEQFAASVVRPQVTSMDADPNVFPFLEATAQLNGVTTEPLVARFENLTTRQLSRFDLLIAADICFWEELVNPVFNLINRAVKAGVKHIVIADPERSTFLDLAQRCRDRHCAETIEWRTHRPVKARGALLILENA